MLKKEYFVSENANCPSDVVCVSFMYGPRLVKFAHSRKEMHFQHRQWSFFAIVDPGGGVNPVGVPVALGWDAVKG